MKRKCLLLAIMLLAALTSGAKVYIPLVKTVPPSTGSGAEARAEIRTSIYSPLAYIDSAVLFISYPESTISSVIITNDSTDMVVFSKTNDEQSSSIQIEIDSFVKFDNAYNISVNAYGYWWVGSFDYWDLKYSTTEQKIIKGITGIIDNPGSTHNYSVFGVAGNAVSGWNYGVSGFLTGTKGGTGIYGSSVYDEGFNTGGRYAGLFHGDLKTTDAIYATVYNTLADSRLNRNSEQLVYGSLDNLVQISVFKYNLNQYNVDNGYESIQLGYYNNDSGILDKEHYGLSGQEISTIYPELVTESQDGYLSINYVEMVPLLIQSIKELKTELDDTKAEIKALKSGTQAVSGIPDQNARLYQNEPNPFSDRCVVKCTIPQNVNDAKFYLYDFSGRQIQSWSVRERGNVQIEIQGNALEAGIYLYSLVLDGVLVDTKRMVHIE